MLKLDFLNKEYTLQEVIDIVTNGNISNFKYDTRFLDFIIAWSLGNHLDGPMADKYGWCKEYDGLLNLMKLDEYGYLGKEMYKIYEICGKDEMEFIKTCDLIGEYSVMYRIDKKTVDTNLKLKQPVSFIDSSIILSSGKKVEFEPNDFSNYNLSFDEEMEFNHEVERSLRHRINESIKENNDGIDLLEEMPTYKEFELEKIKNRKEKAIPSDYEIDINNLYFGMVENDISGNLLGMHMATYSWFEYMNTKVMDYFVFRNVPVGNLYLVDESGTVHYLEKELKKENINDNLTVDKLQIINVPLLFKERIKKDEDSEFNLLTINGILEQLESDEVIRVEQLKTYEPMVRNLFDDMFENTYNGNKQM